MDSPNPGHGEMNPLEDCDGCDMLKGMAKARQSKKKKKTKRVKKEEPMDLTQLGNATWGLLHTMAAYYPAQPTEHKQKHTRLFLHNLGEVFPCSWCAEDWKDVLDRKPPMLDSQPEFSQWLCEAHNDINVRLGKPEFPCENVNKRWRVEKEDLM